LPETGNLFRKEEDRLEKRYYSLATEGDEASIYIYGDITSWPWDETDVSSYNLAREIEDLDVGVINVFINSYGGEVAEGLAIYNSLRRHKAKVKTYCDGFACSVASVVFMSGDERIMSNASLLMIHNAWMFAIGDQNQLRKEADDLETINAASINAYMNHINITEEELKAMMDAETWLSAVDALEMGFATQIVNYATTGMVASQSLRKRMAEMILERQAAAKQHIPEPDPEPEPEPPEPEPEPEPPAQNKPKNLLAALFAAERRV
jgi:ATP-dependent Clp protease protease subunit